MTQDQSNNARQPGEDLASHQLAAQTLTGAGLSEHHAALALRRAYGHMSATANLPGTDELAHVNYDRETGQYEVTLPQPAGRCVMTPQQEIAAARAAIAQGGSLTALPFTLAAAAYEEAHTIAAEAHERQPGRLMRFANTAAHHPIRTGRTCVHAAKMLPTVRKALPWYVLPIVILAAAVKCLPLDFGADETLFAIAFALVLWRRPGLLEALYREAQAGKPAPCWCPKHARHTHGNVIFARKAAAR